MTNEEVKKRINDDLEMVKKHLISLFGNEGSDIGDAGNYAELLGNTMPNFNAPHDSYELHEFLEEVAKITSIPLSDLQRLYIDMINWPSGKWVEEGAYV